MNMPRLKVVNDNVTSLDAAKTGKFKIGTICNQVPDGEYLVILTGHSIQEIFKKPTIIFNFQIMEGEYKGNQVRAFCNANYEAFTSNTKLFQWYAVAIQGELVAGDSIDIDDFYDKIFRAKVESKTSRKTKNAFSNVTELLKCEREV